MKSESSLWNGWPENDFEHPMVEANHRAMLVLWALAAVALLALIFLGVWWLFGTRGLWIGLAWLAAGVLVAWFFGAFARSVSEDFSTHPHAKGERRNA